MNKSFKKLLYILLGIIIHGIISGWRFNDDIHLIIIILVYYFKLKKNVVRNGNDILLNVSIGLTLLYILQGIIPNLNNLYVNILSLIVTIVAVCLYDNDIKKFKFSYAILLFFTILTAIQYNQYLIWDLITTTLLLSLDVVKKES